MTALRRHRLAWWCSLLALAVSWSADGQEPLASWNNGGPKQAIQQFVASVTREGSSTYVPPDQRIATFDNDGTLWVEQPIYTQFVFAIARVKELAPKHPEWN